MIGWIAAAVIAILGAFGIFVALRARGVASAEGDALRKEMQSLLAGQSQVTAAQISQLAQSLTAQLGQVTQQVQSGMASAGTIASSAQKAVSERLEASTQMLASLHQQIGEMQQAGHELSIAAKQIEDVLGGAKTRGTLGEVALDRILADTLPRASYETQFRFSTGEIVDAVVRLSDKLLPIDSKFPLDGYRRLLDLGEEYRKDFSQAVRLHADSISKKYILPAEETLDIALMFVPSEGVYYELLRSVDAKGMPLDEYCRTRCVVPVSPSTLFAHLKIIFLGLRGIQIEENAKRLLASLSGLKKQVDNFGEVYERLGTHLRNAQQSYSDADRKLDRARASLEELAQGAPAEKVLESAAGSG
jgi:DNA recombination protein RmuC